MRRAPVVLLGARHAHGLFARFGFVDAGSAGRAPGSSDLVLVRGAAERPPGAGIP